MKCLKYFFFAVLLTYSIAAKESVRVGNGGGVVFCSSQRPVVLDIYEGIHRYGFTYKKFNKLKASQIDQFINKRLAHFLPTFARMVSDLSEHFDNEVILLDQINFNIPNDFASVDIPPYCKVKVGAVQRIPLLNIEKSFYLDNRVWKKLTSKSKQVLKYHEILYFITLSRKEDNNSLNTRAALAYLLSDQFKYNDDDFNKYFMSKITKLLLAPLDGGLPSSPYDDYWDTYISPQYVYVIICAGLAKRGFTCDSSYY